MKLLRPISLFVFSCIVSIGTLLFYNIPFFNYVANNSNESLGGRIFLLASLVVIMLALNFMMTYLVMYLLRMVGRILLAILSIINATAVYFIFTYSVMIDATTIENVFNTRYSEASGFFSVWLWLFILVFGVVPAAASSHRQSEENADLLRCFIGCCTHICFGQLHPDAVRQ